MRQGPEVEAQRAKLERKLEVALQTRPRIEGAINCAMLVSPCQPDVYGTCTLMADDQTHHKSCAGMRHLYREALHMLTTPTACAGNCDQILVILLNVITTAGRGLPCH
jgi:hypothetical protein